MNRKTTIFDEAWMRLARASATERSWVNEVIVTFNTGGGVYLASLRLWFDGFPLSLKQKQALAARIESFINEDHLGAVNELSWWEFLRREQFKFNLVPTTVSPIPDFEVVFPYQFFVEVSTLNISERDKSKLRAGEAVELDHSETLRRVLGKISTEKHEQLSYAADRKRPAVLVLFDYTLWGGFATLFYQDLAGFLFGERCGFQGLPDQLSPLVYVERGVFNGRIAISRLRSAAYYSPCAEYPLPEGTFPSLNQFSLGAAVEAPVLTDGWVWL
jgi:hypothetical protein